MSITHGDRVAQGRVATESRLQAYRQELDRVQMGPFDKILVGVQVHKAQGHAAVLAVAQNLALVAQAQVHLGERKAVRGLFERLETVLCRRRATRCPWSAS